MILERIKTIIAEELKIDKNEVIYPIDNKMGDFSLPLFKMSKIRKISPEEIGFGIKEDIAKSEKLKNIIISSEVVGGYLNFFIKSSYLIEKILPEIINKKNKYGQNQLGQGDITVFEFSNVNTHKDFHIGHLRNITFGQSICNIFSASGFKSYPISYINDFGIHVAKTIWSYKKNFSENLGKCYSNTVKETEENPLIAQEVGNIMAEIENRQGEDYKVWQKTRKISLQNFNNIYKKLNIKFKKTYFESQVINKGLEMVDSFMDQNIFKKSEGAIIADLEEDGLGILPVIRSDGTALYPVADLALAEKKFRDFKDLKNSYIVVDVRQSLYFKQLFRVLSLAGYKQNFVHLPYEFITLPDGMMSSRSGNSISFDDLYQKVFNKLVEETRARHTDWNDKKIKNNSEKLAVAILKFEMLKVSANKIITFDIEEAVKFEGFNALYILYGLVRIKSILKKGKFKNFSKINFNLLDNKLEKDLSVKLAKYPEIIIKSKEEHDPSEIAKYLFELFKMFNEYYQNINILQSDKEIKKARLLFIKSISQVAENALGLLGISSIDEI